MNRRAFLILALLAFLAWGQQPLPRPAPVEVPPLAPTPDIIAPEPEPEPPAPPPEPPKKEVPIVIPIPVPQPEAPKREVKPPLPKAKQVDKARQKGAKATKEECDQISMGLTFITRGRLIQEALARGIPVERTEEVLKQCGH